MKLLTSIGMILGFMAAVVNVIDGEYNTAIWAICSVIWAFSLWRHERAAK